MVFYVAIVTFSDDTSSEQVNKYCHGWWMSSCIGQTLPSLVNNLWWKIVMDDSNLDEKPLDNNRNIVIYL